MKESREIVRDQSLKSQEFGHYSVSSRELLYSIVPIVNIASYSYKFVKRVSLKSSVFTTI